MATKKNPQRRYNISKRKTKPLHRFLRSYAPLLPLLTIVVTGIVVASHSSAAHLPGYVKGYATDVSDASLLEETNKRRALEGLQPLTLNTKLDAAAQTKAQDMKNRNYWSHVTPDGKEPWDFVTNQQYSYKKAAENLAFGFVSSNSTLNGWMNSAGHRANVMDPDLKEVGFGMVNASNYQGKGEETIIVALYGTPADGIVQPIASAEPTTPITSAPSTTKQVSYLQSLTGDKATWLGMVAGLLMGVIATYLTLKHVHGIRKVIANSEQFVIRHPILDTTLVAGLVLLLVLTQSVGSIH
jgi:uncharacterized protein YkwD